MILKLDLDPGQPVYTLGHLIMLLERAGYRVLWLRQEWSRSRKGQHIMLQLTPNPTDAMEVVALQAVLGSDRYREAANVLRARMLPRVSPFWRRRFNVLYDPA